MRSALTQSEQLFRYKFVPLTAHAYFANPSLDWLISVDGDTYILHANLRRWLEKLNPRDEHYLGKYYPTIDVGFAQCALHRLL